MTNIKRAVNHGFKQAVLVLAIGLGIAGMLVQAVSAAAPTVNTNAASNLGRNTATLNGNATNANSKPITKRGFQYGTTNGYGQTTTENVAISHSFSNQWGWDIMANGALNYPAGITIDTSGNVYVVDTSNHRIQKFNSSGAYIAKFGSSGSGNGQLSGPTGIALDSSGNIYVADTGNHRIQKFNSSGTYLNKWGSYGTGNGQFNSPYGVAVDVSGNIFVLDGRNNRVQKLNSSGTYVAKWGSYGTGNSQFGYPKGIALDTGGNVYVADSDNSRILKYNNAGTFITKFGSQGSGNGQLSNPSGITLDSSGNMYIAELGNNRVQKLNSSGAYLNKWGSYGTGDGQFVSPNAIALDSGGNIYVVDRNNNRIQKFDSSGTYLLQWGGRDTTANGQFNAPIDITTDSSGNTYVVDHDNYRIQKFNSAGTYITQWGSNGSGNGQFVSPRGIAADSSDNIYVVDYYRHLVQKFDSNGTYLTQWGFQGCEYDEAMSDDSLCFPTGIAADPTGNIYVVDSDNNRVQKFDPDGTHLGQLGNEQIFSVQGISIDSTGNIYLGSNAFVLKYDSSGTYITEWGGYGDDDGAFAGSVGDITTDSTGYIYVADTSNNRIQKFNSSGTFVTKWGSPGSGGGQFNNPQGITADPSDNIYVADTSGNLIQKFAASPNTGSFTASISGLTCDTTYHYRAYSTNSDGTNYGNDTTFTTSACPQPKVTTGSASNIGSNNATVYYASVVANVTSVGDGPLSNVGINYGLTDSYGTTLNNPAGTGGTNSFNLTGLTCATTYHYRAFATNSSGTTVGSDATFVSAACPTPAVVETGSAHDIESDNYTNFSATTDLTISDTGNSTVTQAGIQYGLDANYGNSENVVDGLGVGAKEVVLDNLTCETVYHYRAFATNVHSTVYGNDQTFTSSTCPTPAAVQTGSPNDITPEYAEVEVEVTDQGNSNLTDVGVAFGIANSNESSVSSSGAVLGSNIVLIDGLMCETTYIYTAYVTNAYGTTFGDNESFTTGTCEPDPPTNLVAELSSTTAISLDWDTPEFTGMGLIDHYLVRYKEVNSSSWQVYNTGSGSTSTVLGGLQGGSQYNIRLVAVNENGFESIDSMEVTARPGFKQVRNCQDLQNINNNLMGDYELVGDIDCSDTVNWNDGLGFIPIGDCNVIGGPEPQIEADIAFSGILAGNTHTISGLFIDNSNSDDCTAAGLFGLAYGALIQDFKLDGVTSRGMTAGSLAAVTKNTDVTNIQVSNGSIEASVGGGLIGTAAFDETYPEYILRLNSFTGEVISTCSGGAAFLGGAYGAVSAYSQNNGGSSSLALDNTYSNAFVMLTADSDCQAYTGGTLGLYYGDFTTTQSDMYAGGDVIVDIPDTNGKFENPRGVAADSNNNIYVVDSSNNRLQKFDSSGAFISKWGSPGEGDGSFDSPNGIAIDSSDNVYIVDSYNNRVQKFDSNGNYLSQWGTQGSGNGQLDTPQAIAIDSSDTIYVADSNNNRIQKFDSNGNYLSQWGLYGTGNGEFNYVLGLTVDSSANVYVADTNNHRIQKFDSNGNYLSQWGTQGNGNGEFNTPLSIAMDSSGAVLVSDGINGRIQKFDSNGNYLSQWGTHGNGNGQINNARGITTELSGNIYVADSYNHRIQKFDSNGNYISKWGAYGRVGENYASGFIGMTYDSSNGLDLKDSFAHIDLVAEPSLVSGFSSLMYGAGADLSSNYFDADLAQTNKCNRFSSVSCEAITGNSLYFHNNDSNPPLNQWDFDNIWETTATLPVFQAEAVNTVTPITPQRFNRGKGSGGPTTPPAPNPGAPIEQVAPPKDDSSNDEKQDFPSITQVGSPAAKPPGGILERLKDLLSKIPEPVLRSVPYILFGAMLLSSIFMLIESFRQANRLKAINLLIAKQRAVAQQRDTFWHLAANYLRAPITLLMGGVEILGRPAVVAKSLGAAVAKGARITNELPDTKIVTSITELVTSIQYKVSNIMEQIENSESLASIKRPELPAGHRLLRSVRFWLPMTVVGLLLVLANYVANSFRNMDISALTQITQVCLFIIFGMIVYWAANALGLARRKRERAERILSQQAAVLDKARLNLISKTAEVLDSDVADLEGMFKKLPKDDMSLPVLREGSRRLRQMVDSFKLLILAQNHKLSEISPGRANTPLLATVEGSLGELELEIKKKNLRIVKNKFKKISIPGSQQVATQVVSSVLANAVDFSPENSSIEIGFQETDSYTFMSVADHGQGVSKDQQSHIFELFTKADGQDALRMDHGGLGISLYLDREIMEYLGGELAVISDEGHGTTVTMRWPKI